MQINSFIHPQNQSIHFGAVYKQKPENERSKEFTHGDQTYYATGKDRETLMGAGIGAALVGLQLGEEPFEELQQEKSFLIIDQYKAIIRELSEKAQ